MMASLKVHDTCRKAFPVMMCWMQDVLYIYPSWIFFLVGSVLFILKEQINGGRCWLPLKDHSAPCALFSLVIFFFFLSAVIMFFLGCDLILSCLSDCVPTNIKRSPSFPLIARPRAICPSSPRLPDSLAVCRCGRTGVGTYVWALTLAAWLNICYVHICDATVIHCEG